MGIDIKELICCYLDAGKILIIVDSTVDGVLLPNHLMNSIQVKLNLSWSFKSKIFEIDESKKQVRVDLGFKGERFICVLPFASIWYVAMANAPLDGVEIVENMPIEFLELSYHLELQAQKKNVLIEKQIDFMDAIPKDKAQSIELKMHSSNLRSSESNISIEEKLFNDFMTLVKEYEIADQLKVIAEKTNTKGKKQKNINNEIEFADYLNKGK
jgi:hypothetical protein